MILYLLSILSRNGLELVLVKEYSSVPSQDLSRWLGNIVFIVFFMSMIYGVIYILLDIFLLEYNNFGWVTINLFPFSALLVFSFYFRASGSIFLSAVAEPGFLFLVVSLFILSAKFLDDTLVDPFPAFTVVNWILFLIIYCFLLKSGLFKFGCGSFSSIKQQVTMGMPFMLLGAASYIMLWIPAFIIEVESPSSFVAYNLAIRMLAPVTFIIITADFYVSSRFSLAKQNEDTKYINMLFSNFRYLVLIVGSVYVLASLALLFYSKDFVEMITHEVMFFYSVFIMGYFISSLIGPCGMLLNMYGLVKYGNYATWSLALFVLILVIPVFSIYGAQGAAVLVAVSIVVKNLVMFMFLKRFRVLNWFY